MFLIRHSTRSVFAEVAKQRVFAVFKRLESPALIFIPKTAILYTEANRRSWRRRFSICGDSDRRRLRRAVKYP